MILVYAGAHSGLKVRIFSLHILSRKPIII
jgi:hypothetical protein